MKKLQFQQATKLVWITPEVEKIIVYCARVSSPQNQQNEDYAKLLRYCINNHHWSIFEMGNMCVEINTSRAISAQILRHRSFSFQEFSLRYSKAEDYMVFPARRQDTKNRQNSIDDLSSETQAWWEEVQYNHWQETYENYNKALELGIAKETARAILPLNTCTRLYMNGTIRSWIHYLQLRTANGTQREHMEIANGIKEIFKSQLPITSDALGWHNAQD